MSEAFTRYLDTYSGRWLLEKYKLSDEGIWMVRGEDPNCDLGGPHSNPFLGLFEGKLEDVIRHAVNLRGFWHWGAGGNIEKMFVVKVSQ